MAQTGTTCIDDTLRTCAHVPLNTILTIVPCDHHVTTIKESCDQHVIALGVMRPQLTYIRGYNVIIVGLKILSYVHLSHSFPCSSLLMFRGSQEMLSSNTPMLMTQPGTSSNQVSSHYFVNNPILIVHTRPFRPAEQLPPQFIHFS